MQELSNEERIAKLSNLSEKRRKEHSSAVDLYTKEVEKLPNSIEIFKISQKYFDELLQTSTKVCDLDKVIALYEIEDLPLDLKVDMCYYESQAEKLNWILTYIVENRCDYPDITKYSKKVTEEEKQKEIANIVASGSIDNNLINEMLDTVNSIITSFPKYKDYLEEYINITFNLSMLVSKLQKSENLGEMIQLKKELELIRYILEPYKLFIASTLTILDSKTSSITMEHIGCVFKPASNYSIEEVMLHRNTINKFIADAIKNTSVKGVNISIETVGAHINANNTTYTCEVIDNVLVFDLVNQS